MLRSYKVTTINRSNLRFAEEIQKHLSFLTKQYTFNVVFTNHTFVRFESDLVFVNVYHGRSSYELGIEIGRLGFPDEMAQGYTLSELIQLADSDKSAKFKLFAARTPDTVRKGVLQLARLFRTYADKALCGDHAIFGKLHRQREQWKKTFAREVLLAQSRPRAEAAFRRKDYQEVVRLLESLRDALTASELKKLQYAHKHLSEK